MVEWFGVIDGYRYDFALLCGFAITKLIALRQLLRSSTRETAL